MRPHSITIAAFSKQRPSSVPSEQVAPTILPEQAATPRLLHLLVLYMWPFAISRVLEL